MLMNGQEVNHLVVNGESFTSSNYLPALYRFGNGFVNQHYFRSISPSGEFSIWYGQVNFYFNGNYSKETIVSQIDYYKGEEYALVECLLENPDDREMNRGTAWIKVSEMGGMTRLDTTGGGK